MSFFEKARSIISLAIDFLKSRYHTKLIERQENAEGKAVMLSADYKIKEVVFSEGNMLVGAGKMSYCSLGMYTYASDGCYISNAVIGNYCSIGPNTIIGFGDHPANFMSTHPLFYSPSAVWTKKFSSEMIFEEKKSIVIGNDVWIGATCYMKNGISIGTGSIIATGAVVIKDIPEYAIVGGIPAKIIKYRFSPELIDALKKSEWWLRSPEELKGFKEAFVTSDEKIIMNCLSRLNETVK